MIIFDGYALAKQKEQLLMQRVAALKNQGKNLKIAAILFSEDSGSQLYTRLKKEAAERVGIAYEVDTFSMLAPLEEVVAKIQQLNADPEITGIIIQKPWRQKWLAVQVGSGVEKEAAEFQTWWHSLVTQIDERKDVDGLHPSTLAAIQRGTWQKEKKVMPATAKAVLTILAQASVSASAKFIILGKSDILGQPLFYELKNRVYNVEMIGSHDLAERVTTGAKLLDADVIISATGQEKLITGDLVGPGVVVIDVGEPKPDVDFNSVSQKASFITPVPGGVGPMTVVSLLENCVELGE